MVVSILSKVRVLAAQAVLNRALRVQSARSLARAAFVVLLHSVLC